MQNFVARLKSLDACSDAICWAGKQTDYATLWRDCARGDWMLWLLGKLSGPPHSASRRKLVACALACAETATVKIQAKDLHAEVKRGFSLLRDYTRTGSVDTFTEARGVLRSAAAAAYADAYAARAYAAAYAAANAAADADAAAAAAAADAAAYDVRNKMKQKILNYGIGLLRERGRT